MRNYLLAILLCAMCSTAAAEWKRVDGNSTQTVYVDAATIRKTGDIATITNLVDFKAPRTLPSKKMFSSIRAISEFDCKLSRRRTLMLAAHGGSMGSGELVHLDDQAAPWEPVSPKSMDNGVLKIACGKR